jgi:23S rRNA pseudouridine1911/1915/1917 synthase
LLDSQTPPESAHLLVVGEHQEYRRLDQFVAAALAPERSRSQIGRMIKAGLITVNGAIVRASCAIRRGDRIQIDSPVPGQREPVSRIAAAQTPAGSLIEVLFDDAELLAVNKPAGMPAHPSPGHPHSTLADALIALFPDLAAMAEPDGIIRAGIVHRLDKQTSGAMVVARTPFARMALSQQFKNRSVSKVYLALVKGIVVRDRFIVERPLGRHPTERKRMSIRSNKPREALTEFLVLHRFTVCGAPVTLVRAQPHTGRTHQIRVHLASSGHPCLGDELYGGKGNPGWSRAGQALHALALTISHPRSGEQMEFVASPPDDLNSCLMAGGLPTDPWMVRRWIDQP